MLPLSDAGPTRIATGTRTLDAPYNAPSVPLASKRSYTLNLSGTSSSASKVARMSATYYDALVARHPGASDPIASMMKTTPATGRAATGANPDSEAKAFADQCVLRRSTHETINHRDRFGRDGGRRRREAAAGRRHDDRSGCQRRTDKQPIDPGLR
jgi:hypothetical protein